MADISIKYKGSTITELNASGAKILKTSGTYCEGDISVEYIKGPTGIPPTEYAWQQMPTAVKNFIENVTYSASDYSTSSIQNYAPTTVDASNTYSVGKSVAVSTGTLDRNGYKLSVTSGNVTLYNDIPNVYTEYTVRSNGVGKASA